MTGWVLQLGFDLLAVLFLATCAAWVHVFWRAFR
jgi:hypothetical protein